MLEAAVAAGTFVATLAVKVVGMPSQILKILRTRYVGNLSVTHFVTGFVSYVLWTIHGLIQGDWVIIAGQGLGIVTSGILLALIWLYRPRRRREQSLMALLRSLASLDGHVHEREEQIIQEFARRWDIRLIEPTFVTALSVHECRTIARGALESYLGQHPPVEQLRELEDVVWLMVEADGAVTPEEHALVSELCARIQSQLSPDAELLALHRVVIVPQPNQDAAALQSVTAVQPARVGDREVFQSAVELTERAAEQFARELRDRGFTAMAVKGTELQ